MTAGFELRDVGHGTVSFVGYAATTETPYEVGDFTETIARGAFKRTLNEQPDVVLLINHEGLPLARTSAGTMSLLEDHQGLRVDAQLDGTDPAVQALQRKFARGDLDGQMSFGFRVTDQVWSNDYLQRTIKSVTIHRGDVSVVTMGANDATSSMFRGAVSAEQRAKRAKQLGDRMTGSHGGRIVTFGGARPRPARRAATGPVRVPDHTSAAQREFDEILRREGATSFAAWQKANAVSPERRWLEAKRREARR